MSQLPAIRLQHVHKVYANGYEALKGVSFDVRQGDFMALLGPNGAGKSTIIRIISGLTLKTGGTVTVGAHNIDKNPGEARSLLGVVPQEFNFSIFETPRQIVMNQAGYYGIGAKVARKHTDSLFEQLELGDKADGPSRELSGGMKRRLMIARALVHQPRVLILDEPTAGVDIELRRSMWDFLTRINEQGTTIILTTHYLEEAENLCKNIAIIRDGELIHNSDMKSLLVTLDSESYVLDLIEPVDTVAELDGYSLQIIDNMTLEIRVPRGRGITGAMAQLNAQGVRVNSMRNKANRLEELFVQLIHGREEN